MTFWTLYKRELRSIFVSPVAYVVLGGCALIIGSGFAYYLAYMISHGVKGVPLLAAVLDSFIFWFLLLVQVPVISMRAFSEEYKMGTIEMLLTAPVREWEVVLSKFFSVLTLFVLLWVPAAVNFVFLYVFSDQKFDLTWGVALLPFLMIFLVGSFYVSVALFASSLTKNQVVAAILGFALIFLLFCGSILEYVGLSEQTREVVRYFSSLDQLDTFSRGIFDSRPVVFYLSGTLFFLFLTQRVLQSRRLRA